MPTTHKVCQNTDCGKTYELLEGDVDDGYCSFSCWENSNCVDPSENRDVFDTSVEEICKTN